jgi:hypothetical protein
MELSQVYGDATNAFQLDPELRTLLLQTMNAAQNTAQPAMVDIAAQRAQMGGADPAGFAGAKGDRLMPSMPSPMVPSGPGSAAEQFMMSGASVPPPAMAASNQGVNTVAKSGPLPTPPAPPAYNPAQQFAPSAGGAALAAGGAPGGRPPAPRPAAPPQAGGPGFGQQLAAFLGGLGSSNAILPAIGGGMQAVDNLGRSAEVRNQTVRALMGRGLDADTAVAAAQNPELLKAVLPSLFGGKKQLGSVYDDQGREQKVFYDDAGNTENVGSPKRDPATTALTRVQATANVKRVERLKNEAEDARGLQGQLNQLRAQRRDVSYEGWPFAELIAKAGDVTGMSQGAALSAPSLELQLSFTEKTKGAITDREMGMFKAAVPGLNMSDASAEIVISGMEAAAQRKIEQAKFMEAYMSANKGSLEGAQDSWDAYTNANPVINLNPDGSLAVNKANIGNWKDFVTNGDEDRPSNFGPAAGDISINEVGTAAPQDTPAGATPGAVAQPGPGTPMSKPTVTTKEERDALPPGTTYIYNGREFTTPKTR